MFLQVLDVLCSLCVCHGVAVRANQHLICDNLLPGRDLLLQTRLINHVSRYTHFGIALYNLVKLNIPSNKTIQD